MGRYADLLQEGVQPQNWQEALAQGSLASYLWNNGVSPAIKAVYGDPVGTAKAVGSGMLEQISPEHMQSVVNSAQGIGTMDGERDMMPALMDALNIGAIGGPVGAATAPRGSVGMSGAKNPDMRRLLNGEVSRVELPVMTGDQLSIIEKVTPPGTAEMFHGKPVYAEDYLVSSLRKERPKHADRLLLRLPEMLSDGLIQGNPTLSSANRPAFLLEGPKAGYWDTAILDANYPDAIRPVTLMPSPERTMKKGKRP